VLLTSPSGESSAEKCGSQLSGLELMPMRR